MEAMKPKHTFTFHLNYTIGEWVWVDGRKDPGQIASVEWTFSYPGSVPRAVYAVQFKGKTIKYGGFTNGLTRRYVTEDEMTPCHPSDIPEEQQAA